MRIADEEIFLTELDVAAEDFVYQNGNKTEQGRCYFDRLNDPIASNLGGVEGRLLQLTVRSDVGALIQRDSVVTVKLREGDRQFRVGSKEPSNEGAYTVINLDE